MPRGTCQICGCTEDHACVGGCEWVEASEEHCSQCVTWIVLGSPNPFKGIFPLDLVPVRNRIPIPIPVPGTGRTGFAYFPDFRRMDEETLARFAIEAAVGTGHTVDEFDHIVATGEWNLPIPAAIVRAGFSALSFERAFAAAEEWLATGNVGGSTRQDVYLETTPAQQTRPHAR